MGFKGSDFAVLMGLIFLTNGFIAVIVKEPVFPFIIIGVGSLLIAWISIIITTIWAFKLKRKQKKEKDSAS
jgi:hypothetical protein